MGKGKKPRRRKSEQAANKEAVFDLGKLEKRLLKGDLTVQEAADLVRRTQADLIDIGTQIRRTKEESVIHEDIRTVFGGDAPNSGKPWSIDEFDWLVDLYLAGVGWTAICVALGRSLSSVDSKLRLMVIRHPEGYQSYPLSSDRRDRDRKHLIGRDYQILAWAASKTGVANGAWSMSFLGGLLRRNPEGVERAVRELASRRPDGLFEQDLRTGRLVSRWDGREQFAKKAPLRDLIEEIRRKLVDFLDDFDDLTGDME